MTRRDLLRSASAVPILGLLESCGESAFVPIEEVALSDLSSALASRQVTSEQLCAAYLDRIEKMDRHGATVNSVIEINPDAVTIAKELDAERQAKGPRGPLHGVPILIKDNIDTADRMKTTAGSLAMMDAPTPAKDAGVAAKLRASGALILGKTNLSEWANIRSSRSTSGWSGRGGQTRNPYALDRNPSGSSSGSGAAVASSFCAAAIGTETDGSIVSPASINGIVGIKPTVGLLSGSGIIPISHTQDTAGPMARSVRDAAMLLSAVTDNPKSEKDYTRFLDPNGLKNARIGVLRQLFGANPDGRRVAENAIDVMKKAGAEVIDPLEVPSFGRIDDAEFIVFLYELKADLTAYLTSRGGRIRTLKDVIEFDDKSALKEMPYFGQETFLKAQEKGDLTSDEYVTALARCRKLSREDGIDAAMTKHKLDAIFCLTDGVAWPTDWVNGDHFTGGCSTPAAVAGYPHVTVPGGFAYGLPIGVSFFGGAYTEGPLIRIAYAFEQLTKARQRPRYLDTVRFA